LCLCRSNKSKISSLTSRGVVTNPQSSRIHNFDVRIYGVKEYAAILGIEESALQRGVNPEHNPTKETLEKIVAPLNLCVALKPKDAA